MAACKMNACVFVVAAFMRSILRWPARSPDEPRHCKRHPESPCRRPDAPASRVGVQSPPAGRLLVRPKWQSLALPTNALADRNALHRQIRPNAKPVFTPTRSSRVWRSCPFESRCLPRPVDPVSTMLRKPPPLNTSRLSLMIPNPIEVQVLGSRNKYSGVMKL